MKYLVLLFAILSVGTATSVQADVRCGDVPAGGTFENPSRHVLTRDLRCSGPRGVRLPHSHTILDCQGHTIEYVGPQGVVSIGIAVGGTRRSERRHVLNCGTKGWFKGVRIYNADTTLIENRGSTVFQGNEIGIYVQNSSLPVLLGVHAPANYDKGMVFTNVFRPGVVNSSANSNRDSGMFFSNATEPLIRNSEARRNGDPDLVVTNWTHHGYFHDSIFDEIVFANGAHDNHWCRVAHGNIWNTGPTNYEACR